MRILALTTALMVPTLAQALETKENSVVCISQKKLVRFEKLQAANHIDFMNAMKRKAECVEMKKPLNVVVLSEVGDYVKLERLNGMQLWAHKNVLAK